MLVWYCEVVETLWYRTKLWSEFERREAEGQSLAMQWDEKHKSERGRERRIWEGVLKPAVYCSRDNVASTYSTATSSVDPRYSLPRIFVHTRSCYAKKKKKTGGRVWQLCVYVANLNFLFSPFNVN